MFLFCIVSVCAMHYHLSLYTNFMPLLCYHLWFYTYERVMYANIFSGTCVLTLRKDHQENKANVVFSDNG